MCESLHDYIERHVKLRMRRLAADKPSAGADNGRYRSVSRALDELHEVLQKARRILPEGEVQQQVVEEILLHFSEVLRRPVHPPQRSLPEPDNDIVY